MNIEIIKKYDEGSTGERLTGVYVYFYRVQVEPTLDSETTRRMKNSFSVPEFPEQSLGEKNQPSPDKNFWRRNILREDISVVQSKKVKGIRGKRLRKHRILLMLDCTLQKALWMHVKSWRRMGDRGRRGAIQWYMGIRVYSPFVSFILKMYVHVFCQFYQEHF